jgi:hypothetical protein
VIHVHALQPRTPALPEGGKEHFSGRDHRMRAVSGGRPPRILSAALRQLSADRVATASQGVTLPMLSSTHVEQCWCTFCSTYM